MDDNDSRMMTRRSLLQAAAGASTLLAAPATAYAVAPAGFDAWRDAFEAKARARGISDRTYRTVMGRIEPDMSVFAKMRKQPRSGSTSIVASLTGG